jgi:hypothetical protein
MGDAEFKNSYPTLWDFLETTLWPDVDNDNLFEMLHRTMKFGPAEWTKRTVEEFQKLSDDDRFDRVYLAELFNREIGSRYRVFSQDNARELLWTLAQYLRYLYNEEGVQGKNL